MPPILHHIQPSFAGGELSPGLYSRVDIAKYHTGLKTARNVNILAQGGVRNRAGFKYVAASGDSTNAVRLIPFIDSNSNAFVIEFGHQYVRFFLNGAPYSQATAYATPWVAGGNYYSGNYS